MGKLKGEEIERNFSVILDRGSSEARSIFAFVRRTLRQFRLNSRYEPSDILMEVYLRAVSGDKVIEKTIPWIRSTAYNIIRELRRKEDKQREVSLKLVYQLNDKEFDPLESSISLETIEENLNRLNSAFERLSDEDKELFRLRLVENGSWKSIQEILINRGEDIISTNTLSKRYSRALSRLRKNFHETLQDAI